MRRAACVFAFIFAYCASPPPAVKKPCTVLREKCREGPLELPWVCGYVDHLEERGKQSSCAAYLANDPIFAPQDP